MKGSRVALAVHLETLLLFALQIASILPARRMQFSPAVLPRKNSEKFCFLKRIFNITGSSITNAEPMSARDHAKLICYD
jgi:hypothetical protein